MCITEFGFSFAKNHFSTPWVCCLCPVTEKSAWNVVILYHLIYSVKHSSKFTIRHLLNPNNHAVMQCPGQQCNTQARARESHNNLTNAICIHTHRRAHSHTHSADGKDSLGKVTSTMKHAELHCWASLPVRHWCGNSHLRVIMGWLAPQVWDPGADSLGSRKRAKERGGEKICTLNSRMSHSLHPSNSLCSVSFSVSSSSFSSPDLSPPLSWCLNICCFLSWSF